MLGTAIRQAREEKGMSQERLAEELGVSRQAVSKWEIEQSVPTPRNLEGIEAALDLPAGTLAELLKEEEREPSSPKISKKCILLTSVVGVAVLVMAFSLGWFVSQQSSASHGGELSPGNGQVTMNFQSPQGAIDAAVTVPTQEDGTVLFDMPLSSPGEEERLAWQLEYHQWPDHLELECSELADFDLDRLRPWGSPEEYLPEGWEVDSELQMEGNCTLALVRTEEPYDGPTCWFLGRGGGRDWNVLFRCNEEGLVWNQDDSWATFVGNVLGYPSFVVRCDGDEHAVFFSVIDQEPRIVFHITEHLEGMTDLDLDGELEIVARPQGEAPRKSYQIYDRLPDGYCIYTMPEEIDELSVPEGYFFLFYEPDRAFGFSYEFGTKWYLDEYAPVYDRLSPGFLWRRDGVQDTRTQGGAIGGTIKAMIGRSAKVAENGRIRKQRELDALTARDRELDMLFERLYEDNVAGKIDDARFAKMSKRYEQEQGENAKKIKALRLELKKDESKRMDIDDFLETVRRYTDATTITKRMVAELIDHIEVYHAEKQDGVTNQRVVIYYNCIGAFDVPDRRKIPEADIIMETRKGVALSYAPEQVAV